VAALRTVIEGFFLFLLGWLLAQVEIQIEGPAGWAANLPTWRWGPPWWLKLSNGKPVTGYHFFLLSFLICVFHLPVLFFGFSPALEGRVIASYFLMGDTWDFQWFVWNPAWGWRRFSRERIWWFPVKILGFPMEYWMGAGLYALSAGLLWKTTLRHAAALAGCVLIFNFLAVLLASALQSIRRDD